MNKFIREVVRKKMKYDRTTQTELAEKLGMPRPNLVRLITGNAGQIPRRWQEVLDALELELIAVPKHWAEMAYDSSQHFPKRPVRYSKMTADERKARDERDVRLKIPKDILELRSRWDAGEFDEKPNVWNIERYLYYLDNEYESSSTRSMAIRQLRDWLKAEVASNDFASSSGEQKKEEA